MRVLGGGGVLGSGRNFLALVAPRHRTRSTLRAGRPPSENEAGCLPFSTMKFFSVTAALAIPLMVTTLTGCNLLGGLLGAALPFAGIKLAFACIPEGTLIDTTVTPSPIEEIEPGDLVIGYSGRPVRVLQKHSYLEDAQTIFLRIQFTDGARVDLCSRHRLAGVPANRLRAGQTIAGRTVAKIETRTGETRSFDFLTEDAGYRINGVPVNSMIEEMHAAAAGLPMQRLD